MAEEGTLGLARGDGGEPSKEELQRRMEEARETITQTVTEIKETVTNQYYSMKETVSDALDWRHHFRRNPVAFSVGALSAGFLLGYGLAGALKGGGGGGRRDDYPSAEETDVYARTGATPQRYEDEDVQRRTAFHGHSYAAQPITDSLRGGGQDSAYERVTDEADEAEAGDYNPPRGADYAYASLGGEEQAEEEKPQRPGLLERFKETSAYDRLQAEVSSLGNRFMEELSSTAHTVVLPALFNKVRELFGVDLSNKQGQGGGGGQQKQRETGGAAAEQSGGQDSEGGGHAGGARAASAAASSSGAASRGSSTSSYATSENRGYGAQSEERGADNSVLDLDR
ncbi:MAG TPA: hypothetical protein VJ715_07495 [Pyrinomonadaceae bacterium]|nr:hypothetical protein [Pyrinomonadaceae bacterium]